MQKYKRLCLGVFIALLASPAFPATENSCTYTTYKWNVNERKVVDFKQVKHSYASLDTREIDPLTACTVCNEDQELIKIATLPAFKVCKLLAKDIRKALNLLLAEGQPIFKITGYRVGMTRGQVDEEGNRTQFSNHSFGIALDINEHMNGLYDRCIEYGPGCRLRKGGKWQPGTPGSLVPEGKIVKTLKATGLQWGGEIQGYQKDFMHFSPTGY